MCDIEDIARPRGDIEDITWPRGDTKFLFQ